MRYFCLFRPVSFARRLGGAEMYPLLTWVIKVRGDVSNDASSSFPSINLIEQKITFLFLFLKIYIYIYSYKIKSNKIKQGAATESLPNSLFNLDI